MNSWHSHLLISLSMVGSAQDQAFHSVGKLKWTINARWRSKQYDCFPMFCVEIVIFISKEVRLNNNVNLSYASWKFFVQKTNERRLPCLLAHARTKSSYVISKNENVRLPTLKINRVPRQGSITFWEQSRAFIIINW